MLKTVAVLFHPITRLVEINQILNLYMPTLFVEANDHFNMR